MSIKFDFADLEAFVTICETGSFVVAAQKLNVSQSALTRRIQKLEGVLGVVLFERTTRNLRLTLSAKGFRQHASDLLDDAREAVTAVSDQHNRFDHQRSGTVTVAAVPTATHNILPSVITLFRTENQRARIRISDLSANDVLEAVAQGEADFGINFIGAQEPGLDFRVLTDDRFVLAVNRADPLAERDTVEWGDLDESQFIAVWKGSGNRMLIDNALAAARQSLNWAYEVRHLSTALGLVEAGIGVTALPASAMPEKDHPLVVGVPLENPEVSRTIGTVRRSGSQLSRVAEDFYQALLKRWSAPPP